MKLWEIVLAFHHMPIAISASVGAAASATPWSTASVTNTRSRVHRRSRSIAVGTDTNGISRPTVFTERLAHRFENSSNDLIGV